MAKASLEGTGNHAGNLNAETEPGSHVATQAGYAHGKIIEAGQSVPAGLAVCELWMAPANAPAEEAAGE